MEMKFTMSTQIADTPILKGDEAISVINEARQKADAKIQRAFEMLEAKFSKMIVKRLD